MDFHAVNLVVGDDVAADDCRVDSQASMVEVFRKSAGGGHPYLFVEDGEGNPVGIIAAEDILQKVTNPSPNELTQWMDLPVETAVQGRIEMPHTTGVTREDARCIHVSRHGRLLGIITENDVLVSWRSMQKTLQHSQGDAVTGLPNRASFDQHLQAELNRADRSGHSVAVILVDLDYFKQINDRFGHAAGDAALNVVAQTIRRSLRSYDLVARFGGDEFAVICSACRPGEIDIVVRRIREVVLGLQTEPDAPRPVPSISVGAAVAHVPSAVASPEALVSAADACLYAAKRAGRNCAWKSELHSDWRVTPVFVKDKWSTAAVHDDAARKVRS